MDSRLLKRLREPDCYPGHHESVDLKQTHMSVICLAGDDVYKLKKPVRFPFADFSTVEKREHFCHEELRLNRRLCPELYREVVPLYKTPDGSWSFCLHAGEIVDHAVLMYRLPAEKMMDRLLEEDAVNPARVRHLARIMVTFHQEADHGPKVLELGDPSNLREAALYNFSETESVRDTIFDAELHDVVEKRTRAEFDRLLPRLRERAGRGRIVDGHGDLHARNICLTDPPAIYDCIEFNPGLRCEDVTAENAFLAMDLIYRGHPELAHEYIRVYLSESGDEEQQLLLPALISYRAMVRAKIAAFSAKDPDLEDDRRNHERESARHHLQLAASSLVCREKWLVIGCGLPATGKTTLLERLARRSGWPCLSTDVIRKQLAGCDAGDELPERYYETDFSQRTYGEMISRAEDALKDGPVILDANFGKAETREKALHLAGKTGARVLIIWLRADEETIRQRLAERDQDADATSDADLKVYQLLKDRFEPPSDAEGIPFLQLDGDDEVDHSLNAVLAHLLRAESGGRMSNPG